MRPNFNAFASTSRVTTLVRAATAALALLVMLGCHSNHTCENPKSEYRLAKEQAPLRVPEGMAKPDRSAALVVPPAAAQQPAPERRGCLEDPPSYFGASGRVARTPEEVVASWAQAWADRDADAVVTLYSESFVAPTDVGRGPWLGERREQIATGPVPEPKLQDLKVRDESADRRIASFTQRFGSNVLRKELTLVREAGSWRIVAERVMDVQ